MLKVLFHNSVKLQSGLDSKRRSRRAADIGEGAWSGEWNRRG